MMSNVLNVMKGGTIGTNAPGFVIEQLQQMGEITTLKEVKDKTPILTMPTREEVVAEVGVEQPELMEMAEVVMPTMQDQRLRMKRMIAEEFTRSYRQPWSTEPVCSDSNPCESSRCVF